MMGVALLAALTVCAPHPARSRNATAAFRRANPCPATGKTRGACPGYVVDHVTPLCAGGHDGPDNMTWQTAKDGAAKDKTEDALCAWIRRICKGQKP